MTLSDFEQSVAQDAPPAESTGPLQGLWWAAKGEWDRAHRLVQDDPSREAAWVHAYLHRAEGDLDNAAYWYRRAGQAAASGALETEWKKVVAALLSKR